MIGPLADHGYCIVDDLLPASALQALQQAALSTLAQRGKPAGIGRHSEHQLDAATRGDHIAWLEPAAAADSVYLDCMEQLRLTLNRELFLGLFRYECHYACYEPGAFYRKHLDAFRGERNRVLSTVFYLNDGWRPEEGGALVLYDRKGDSVADTVLPQANRLVVFLSEAFPHEVLPATRQRLSIAGWFRGA